MPTEKPVNLRHGHRERVRRQFLAESAEKWEDYRLLELLLFYSIPQKDVKELAHLLVRQFGSLENVLNASEEELCLVKGIGTRTVEFLHCFRDTLQVKPPQREALVFSRAKTISDYFIRYYEQAETAEPRLLLLNSRYEALANLPLAPSEQEPFSPKEVMRAVLRYNATAAVIAIPTTQAILIPTPEQMNCVHRVKRMLNEVDACLLECVLVGEKRAAFLLAHLLGDAVFSQQKLTLE